MQQFDGTTILSVRRGQQVALGGDGQVTLGNIVIKSTARAKCAACTMTKSAGRVCRRHRRCLYPDRAL